MNRNCPVVLAIFAMIAFFTSFPVSGGELEGPMLAKTMNKAGVFSWLEANLRGKEVRVNNFELGTVAENNLPCTTGVDVLRESVREHLGKCGMLSKSRQSGALKLNGTVFLESNGMVYLLLDILDGREKISKEFNFDGDDALLFKKVILPVNTTVSAKDLEVVVSGESSSSSVSSTETISQVVSGFYLDIEDRVPEPGESLQRIDANALPGFNCVVEIIDAKTGQVIPRISKQWSTKGMIVEKAPESVFFYEFRDGQEYQIRIQSMHEKNSEHQYQRALAVETIIDGCNIFCMGEENATLKDILPFWVLRNGKTMTIRGWVMGYENGQLQYRNFKVGSAEDSVAALMGRTPFNFENSYGSIRLVFKQAYDPGEKQGTAKTGLGTAGTQKANKVPVAIGETAYEINIMYDFKKD